MKIRVHHPILDRIKIIIILLVVLLLLGKLVSYVEEGKEKRKEGRIETLIQTALQPVGSIMYIWGGGWDDEDKIAGIGATQIGMSDQWELFMAEQNEGYDYTMHRFEREKGLDCSGYVGWVIYNTFETESGKDGYVTKSTDMAEQYANRGWGKLLKNPDSFLPGDIVSMEGHVWISLGTCSDGSVLLVHSSPPGVSVCGTLLENGNESIAVQLAEDYMKNHHPRWQELYPNRGVTCAYVKEVSVLRWNKSTMLDAKTMQELSAEELLVFISQKH